MREIKITFNDDERLLLHSLVVEERYKKNIDYNLACNLNNRELKSYYSQNLGILGELEEKLGK